jgi:hypothetical protein
MGAESKTDYSDLNANLRAKSDSGPLYLEGEPADGDGFSPGTIYTSGYFTIDHPDDGSKSNDRVVNNAQLRLSTSRPGSASPGHGSVTHQASKLRVNTEITQGSTSYVNLNVTKELEDREYSVSTGECDEGGDDTRSIKGSMLSAISGDNPAFDGNMSELRDDQPDHTQPP